MGQRISKHKKVNKKSTKPVTNSQKNVTMVNTEQQQYEVSDLKKSLISCAVVIAILLLVYGFTK